MRGREALRSRCDAIRDQVPLSTIAARTVKLKRSGNEWKGCCPFHEDRNPSFTIYADDRRFMCFGCGAEGDVLDFVRRTYGADLSQALEMLDQGSPARPARLAHEDNERDRSIEAQEIWRQAQAVQGTAAEAYLRSRGITRPLPDSIRFATLPLGQRPPMPALVAAVSSLDGQVIGIQRTFLSDHPIGKARLPGGKVKYSLGRVRGGAIRLGPAARSLILTEGLEDGLSVQQQLGEPVWVAAGAGMLPAMKLPALVREVVIGADNDAAGRAAAAKAADAYASSGRRVRVLYPDPRFKDFNAQLQGS